MKITKHKVVTADYTLTNDQGTVIDTSKGHGPLVYIHGTGGLIPGLEAALEGKTAGDTLQVTIAPENAYGARRHDLVEALPRHQFEGVEKIEAGMQFQARGPQGMQVIRVIEVIGDEVKVDANHPLAGVTLHFDVNVVAVRDATGEELAHGHVHAPGGHHH